MNDITLRVREIFNLSGKTQSDFARELNVTPAYIWKILNKDDAVPSERLIDDICEKNDIRKEWLEKGIEPMKVQRTQNQIITDFAANLLKGDESFKKRLIEALAQLDESEWETLEKIALNATKKD